MTKTKTKTAKLQTCSICHGPIEEWPPGWLEGNNAQPVTDGRCCTACNDDVVIPERIRRMLKRAAG